MGQIQESKYPTWHEPHQYHKQQQTNFAATR